MDPATLAITSLVGSAIGGGVSAFGQLQSGQAAKDAGQYSAAVARNNQVYAQQDAQRAAEAGGVRAQSQDFQNRAKQGYVAAAQGASGIGVESKSSGDVRDSLDELGRFDTQTVMDNALAQSRASTARAQSFGEQATLDTFQGNNAATAGYLGAAGSIIGGASSFSDKWLKFRSTSVPGF